MYKLLLCKESWKRIEDNNEVLFVPKNASLASYDRTYLDNIGMTYILKRKNSIFVSPGIVRQFPIYFDTEKKEILDKPNSSEYKFNKLSIQEILGYGYVTGESTILNNLNQFRAGLSRNFNEDGFQETNDYVDTIPEKATAFKPEEVKTALLNNLTEIFNETGKLADDKRIIVPLSGGYDSRLIVCMLRKQGIKNVICASYGHPGTGEVETEISKRVANILGYDWYFVPYEEQEMKDALIKEEFIRYLEDSHGFSSLPHIQEYLLMKKMQEDFPGESFIFVPGHSADFLAGSHLTPAVMKAKSLKSLTNAVISKHLVLRNLPAPKSLIENTQKQLSSLSQKIAEPYLVFELWDWFERQSKFIVNSMRLYEWFNHNWWLPFWDKRFVDFWIHVPKELKYMKEFYDKFVEEKIFSPMNVDFDRYQKQKMKKKKKIYEETTNFVFGSKFKKRIKDLYMKRFYHNPWGMDIIGKEILEKIKENYPLGMKKCEVLLNKWYPSRGYDPNSYIADILVGILLENKRANTK